MTTTTRDMTDCDAAPEAVKIAYRDAPHTRLYLVTTYSDGTTWHRTGYIGRTTGTRPAYLLVPRSSDDGSSDLLSASIWGNTVVAGVQRMPGGGYVDQDHKPVKPGRNRYEEPAP